jgi:hypothetical protein
VLYAEAELVYAGLNRWMQTPACRHGMAMVRIDDNRQLKGAESDREQHDIKPAAAGRQH